MNAFELKQMVLFKESMCIKENPIIDNTNRAMCIYASGDYYSLAMVDEDFKFRDNLEELFEFIKFPVRYQCMS